MKSGADANDATADGQSSAQSRSESHRRGMQQEIVVTLAQASGAPEVAIYQNAQLSPLTVILLNAYSWFRTKHLYRKLPLKYLALLALPESDFRAITTTLKTYFRTVYEKRIRDVLGLVVRPDFGRYIIHRFALRVTYVAKVHYIYPRKMYRMRRFSFYRSGGTFEIACSRVKLRLKDLRQRYRKLHLCSVSISGKYSNACPVLGKIDRRLSRLWKRSFKSPCLHIPRGRWWLERGFSYLSSFVQRDLERTHCKVTATIMKALFFYRHNENDITVSDDFAMVSSDEENRRNKKFSYRFYGPCKFAYPLLCNHHKKDIAWTLDTEDTFFNRNALLSTAKCNYAIYMKYI